MDSFYHQVGKMALASRLRMLSEKMLEEAAAVYEMYQVPLKPKWFPVYFLLKDGEKYSITKIAEIIGHTHPSVSNIVKEMVKAGWATEQKDQADKRRNVISLTEKGRAIAIPFKDQYEDVDSAVDQIINQSTNNIWKALDELEYLLAEKNLLDRIKTARKEREARYIEIVPFEAKYQKIFRDLNEAWISQYFKMEKEDYKVLDHPNEKIIEQGGYIFMALFKGEPLGTCALIKMDDPDYEFELAKMAVSPRAQGKGMGYLLGKKILEYAKQLNAKKIYLESNTILQPAIRLYQKLGFVKITHRPSPYERCNIQMEVVL